MDHGILGSGRDIPGSDRDILGLNRDTVDSGGCSKDLGVGAADCNTAEGNSLGGRLSGSGETVGFKMRRSSTTRPNTTCQTSTSTKDGSSDRLHGLTTARYGVKTSVFLP